MSARQSINLLLLFAPCAALTPWALEAQPRQVVSTSISLDNRGVPVAATVGAGPAYHPARVLVRFRHGAPAVLLPGSGAPRAFPRDPDLFLVPTPPGLAVAETVRRYKASANVEYAEPDYVLRTAATPTDPMWGQQWDMIKISAPAAWDAQTDSSDVIVGIIDTGIDFTHTDLQANLWVNPADSSHGFTCINGSCVAGGSDDFGHGTHVAGTIGAAADNGLGIAGINWSVKLMSLKFLDSSGSGSTSDAVLCFNKVTELKQQGVNIRLTSNSWGGGGYSQALKDAMAQAEAAGVMHVCAAGNSGQNADAVPMYPAAYDNRGIVSVLATDQNDFGASFTNYGLASVDIAAPGVSTLSTVPTATCTLCDPSGYKLLSGTSMATPHVSGALAALFHKNPALDPNHARDVVLDPSSYDAMTDPKAQTTSTGGRLNFNKALSSPRLFSNTLNNFPTLTMGSSVFASAGSQVNLSASASDPDNDPLRMAWAKSAGSGSTWLFGAMLNTLFPNPSGSSVSFTAPSLARTAIASYDASVSDGRGGGAHGSNFVTVSPAPAPGQPPTGTLTVSPTDAPAGSTITVSFPATDPEGGPVSWDMWIGQKSGASGSCCFSGSSTTVTLNDAGVYRIGTQAIDKELNLSSRQSAVVRIGGATGEPPVASASIDKLSGVVPLTVNIDMSASSDADGTVQYYFFNCGGGSFTPGSQSAKGSCVFTMPGTYWIMLQVQDNSGNVDLISAYAVATPVPPGPDTTPPTVSITSPAANATVTGSVSITAAASDDSSGVKQVAFYLDSSALLGTKTASPYTLTWDSSAVTPGPHTLYAIATDNANNTKTSAAVSITVNAPPLPQVSIMSPSAGTVSANVVITANASDTTSGIKQVDFYRDAGVLLGTKTAAPYTITWDSSATLGNHTLYAIAMNNSSATKTSVSVSVTVNAPTPPAVTITSPTNGSTVSRRSTITMLASVTPGTYAMSYVDFYVGSTVVCSHVTTNSCSWQVSGPANKTYQLQAKAYDAKGLVGVSPIVTVTSK